MRGPTEVNGIILFQRNYRERDKLVKIFTESAGKKMFFVKNANKKNSPLLAAVQPFTQATYIAELKEEGLSFLNGVKDIVPFKTIQLDIFISAYATYILNLVDVAIEDHSYDPALFGFTKQALTLLDEGSDPEIITNIFEIQLLQRFGLSFNFESCGICQETNAKFDFSHAYNGLLCEKHWHMDERRSHFSPTAIHFIRLFNQISLSQIKTIDVSDKTKEELRRTIDELYDEYVGIHLKSKTFIDKMKSWENLLKK